MIVYNRGKVMICISNSLSPAGSPMNGYFVGPGQGIDLSIIGLEPEQASDASVRSTHTNDEKTDLNKLVRSDAQDVCDGCRDSDEGSCAGPARVSDHTCRRYAQDVCRQCVICEGEKICCNHNLTRYGHACVTEVRKKACAQQVQARKDEK